MDAGALAILSQRFARSQKRELLGEHLVLTPHAGELARLLSAWAGESGETSPSDVRAAPLANARLAAELTGCTVLLKGSITVIVTPGGRCRVQAEAPPWLATAGAGDVLAGVVATLLAAGLAPFDAAAMAAFVHGRAASRAAGIPDHGGVGQPLLAEDVVEALPGAVAELLVG